MLCALSARISRREPRATESVEGRAASVCRQGGGLIYSESKVDLVDDYTQTSVNCHPYPVLVNTVCSFHGVVRTTS